MHDIQFWLDIGCPHNSMMYGIDVQIEWNYWGRNFLTSKLLRCQKIFYLSSTLQRSGAGEAFLFPKKDERWHRSTRHDLMTYVHIINCHRRAPLVCTSLKVSMHQKLNKKSFSFVSKTWAVVGPVPCFKPEGGSYDLVYSSFCIWGKKFRSKNMYLNSSR